MNNFDKQEQKNTINNNSEKSSEFNYSGWLLLTAIGSIAVGIMTSNVRAESIKDYAAEAVKKADTVVSELMNIDEILAPTPATDGTEPASEEPIVCDFSPKKDNFDTESENTIKLSVSVLPLIRCNEDNTECTTNEYCIVKVNRDCTYETAPCAIEVTKDDSGNVTITESPDNFHLPQ